ncbi:MAG: hypothetical protein ACOY3E_06465 [Pseudomonadota bacterium]
MMAVLDGIALLLVLLALLAVGKRLRRTVAARPACADCRQCAAQAPRTDTGQLTSRSP